MSRAGQFKTPAQILPKHLKWQEDVVVPEHFSADEIVQLKKFARMAGDEASGYEPVYLSCWNGQPTLRDDGYVKLNMEKGEGNLEDAAVKMEHAHADDGDGSDALQYMSQECCASADLPAKPSKNKKTTKVVSGSSSTRKSLSGTTSKAKAMHTAVSVKKSGSASPTAAKSPNFSGEILHSNLARSRARVLSFLRRYRQRKSWRVFHLAIEPRLISASWPPALFHKKAASANGAARHNTCFY
jgi:hypothetical protein